MGTPRNITENQLSHAEAALAKHVAQLKADGVAEADFSRDTKWRHLNGDASQIRARLATIAKVEENNAEVAKRKAEREAATAE